MEFLLYLSTQSMDVYNLISQKTRVVENSSICRDKDVFGFYDPSWNQMTICTEKIKNFGNTSFYINQTLLHESVHLAQNCKQRRGFMFPIFSSGFSVLGVPSSKMKLSPEKMEWLDRAAAFNPFNPMQRQIEREAFWMEDSPNLVKRTVQHFCF